MKLHNKTVDVFVPDSVPVDAAIRRTTHMGIGAHQDDLEIMALHGILKCYGTGDRWFTGVTCTNGAGSPRTDIYATFTDEQMQAVRRVEQRNAASVGGYAAMLQLAYPSAPTRDPMNAMLVEDLTEILTAAKPDVVYTHNLADKHDTHVAVGVKTILALRRLAPENRPQKVYGCEVWRGLDWMMDTDKVPLDVSARDHLTLTLTGLFDSQIAGGKRYDLASQGRRRANATYFESHGIDKTNQLTFAMDLTPLIQDPSLDLLEYVLGFVRSFEVNVRQKLASWTKT